MWLYLEVAGQRWTEMAYKGFSQFRQRTSRRSAPVGCKEWLACLFLKIYNTGTIKGWESHLVAGRHPATLLDKGGGLLVDLGLGSSNLVLEWDGLISKNRGGRSERSQRTTVRSSKGRAVSMFSLYPGAAPKLALVASHTRAWYVCHALWLIHG